MTEKRFNAILSKNDIARHLRQHPEAGKHWGSTAGNFWFISAKGKTDKLSVSYAIRRLKTLTKQPIKSMEVIC